MREDWVKVELGKVCEKAVKIKRKEMSLSQSLKYFDIGGIDNITNKITGYKEYTWSDAPSRAQQIIKKGDTLFSTVRTYLKNIAKVDKVEYAGEICSSGFTVLRGLKNVLNSDYLFHYSLSIGFLNPLSQLQTGTSYPAVRDKDVFAQKIPLAPLPIQRAIVTKIENLFASLDKGISDLKKAQEQLKVYRQAVLKKAFEGDWEMVKLNCVVNELSQGWSPKCQNINSKNEDEWAVIKTSAIQHGVFIESENKVLPEKLEPREQHEIKIGDILITRAGPRSRVGVCCLVKQTRPKLINCDKVYRLRLSDKILNDFFMYKMNSVEFLNKIEEIKTGGNDSGVNITQNRFLNLEFELPPVDKQKQINKEIESRLSVCDKVEQNISEALDKSEALRQSILKKAFEGKLLTEAEIEKCKQEADYEPASVLLERIKKEKK